MDFDEGEIGSEAVRKGRESCCHGGMGYVVLVIELGQRRWFCGRELRQGYRWGDDCGLWNDLRWW